MIDEPPVCPCGHYEFIHINGTGRCTGWARNWSWRGKIRLGRLYLMLRCGCRRVK